MKPPVFQKKTITQSEDFGEKLKKIRQKKRISITRAEHETKIRARYLESIESNRFDVMPPSHSKGFIRRYAEYLGLPSEYVEKQLEQLFHYSIKKQPFSLRPLDKRTAWFITPRVLASVFSILVLIGFIGYITYQVRQFSAPPVLEITVPVGESVVTAESVTIEGKTDVGATVFVDNLQATTRSDGTFSYIVTLRPGLNQITVRSENRIKRQTNRVLSILYQPPAILPTPSPPPTPNTEPPSSNPTQ